jgi:hypothetical protein
MYATLNGRLPAQIRYRMAQALGPFADSTARDTQTLPYVRDTGMEAADRGPGHPREGTPARLYI